MVHTRERHAHHQLESSSRDTLTSTRDATVLESNTGREKGEGGERGAREDDDDEWCCLVREGKGRGREGKNRGREGKGGAAENEQQDFLGGVELELCLQCIQDSPWLVCPALREGRDCTNAGSALQWSGPSSATRTTDVLT